MGTPTQAQLEEQHTLGAFLQELYEWHSEKARDQAKVREVVNTLVREIDVGQWGDVAERTLAPSVSEVVHETLLRFWRSLDLESPPERVVTLPTSVVDTIIRGLAKGPTYFFSWAAGKQQWLEGATTQGPDGEAICVQGQEEAVRMVFLERVQGRLKESRREKDPLPLDPVYDLVDAAAAVMAACSGTGSKPEIGAKDGQRALEACFREYCELLRKETTGDLVRTVLGGASAVIADILTELGVRADVCPLYHSKEQARLYGKRTMRLRLDDMNWELQARTSANANDPTRHSYALEFDQDDPLPDKTQSVGKTDRIVFRIPQPTGSKEWQEAKVVEWSGWQEELDRPPVDDAWPFVAGFCIVDQDSEGCLCIRFVGPEDMEKLANRYRYAILSGVGVRNFQQSGPQVAIHGLLDQLEILMRNGTTPHLEISGEAKTYHRISPFVRGLRKRIRSMGINHHELQSLAQAPDFPPIREFSASSLPAEGMGIFRRYVQAESLARALALDRLYVHGNEVDLILRRGATPGMLRNEIQADLFAKEVVIVAIYKRSFEDWQQELQQLLMTSGLTLTLAPKGFRALLQFALVLGCHELGAHPLELSSFVREMARSGYYLRPGTDEYSVAVVPVAWPDGMKSNMISTSAGDICSGISLVFGY